MHNVDEYDSVKEILEEFVCALYTTQKNGLKRIKKVDEARMQLFTRSYSKTDNMELFRKNIINFDASAIPPCQRELQQQMLRSKYIANIWKSACEPVPSQLNPVDNGWTLSEGKYTFKWFEGEEIPEKVQDILLEDDEGNISKKFYYP